MSQRRSDKHSRRIDDELAEETADLTHGAPVPSRSRADLVQEDPADDAPATAGPTGATPTGLDPSAAEIRTLLAQSLRPGVFPAGRERLLEAASEVDASGDVVALLAHLPADRQFDVLEQVFEALGGHGEDRGHRS